MKKQLEVSHCFECQILRPVKELYRLSWRYSNKSRTYTNSKVKIIYTGYGYYCKKCLKSITKE